MLNKGCYKQFFISDDEKIDTAYSTFNNICSSLKALAFPSKWRPKVTAIDESTDLEKLSLDELIGNLKVHEVILDKDEEADKVKKEKNKSIALKAKESEEGEYEEDEDDILNNDKQLHLLFDHSTNSTEDPGITSDLQWTQRRKNEKAFLGGAWDDEETETQEEGKETCLMDVEAPSLEGNDEACLVGQIDNESKYGKVVESGQSSKIITFQKEEVKRFKKNSLGSKTNHLRNPRNKTFETRAQLKRNHNAKVVKRWVKIGFFYANHLGPNRNWIPKILINKISVFLNGVVQEEDWIIDSGCTTHMTGNKDFFTKYTEDNGGDVIFGGDVRGKIVGKRNITNYKITLEDVLHIKNLSFNFLSVGKICDKGYNMTFTKSSSHITKDGKNIINGLGKRAFTRAN
ncbi:uncharacterized protein [Rutidosis leptorrhynchoides]|uniref:uncharacterized protein n=1 Tax=Rutidosis leptorrhynchoides TaxID=125765 RepID=UPI003A992594